METARWISSERYNFSTFIRKYVFTCICIQLIYIRFIIQHPCELQMKQVMLLRIISLRKCSVLRNMVIKLIDGHVDARTSLFVSIMIYLIFA
ncbi:hypothetical protein WA026_023613 [Henosepilachna vigintioctopunctata]|uniref:Uncharacterized protein n=1 Tax=Henosepilachna vigintioctopunctata TaxID=420089 RepID=A0AAW1TYJ9_9CUCU